MISGFFRAIQQLGDPRITHLIFKAAFISAAISFLLAFAIGWAISSASVFNIGWLDKGIAFFGGSAALLISLFLYPCLTCLVISFMLDDVASAVEARHFPNLPTPRREAVIQTVVNTSRFACVAITLNLLVFIFVVPVLIFTVFLTPLIPFVLYALNGYLVGREYFELAANRRLDPQDGQALRKRHKARVFICGIVIAILMTVPLVNWLMPIIATAFMVHVFEDARQSVQGTSEAA